MTYCITGATGEVGSRVVARLLDRGERPRVFVRDAAKARTRYRDRVDICVGDLADPPSLARAIEGVDVLFLVNSGPELAQRDAAASAAAKAAGVKRLVKLSSMDARQRIGTGAWHAQGEAAICASGIAFTFLQPGGFMSNALHWAASIKAQGLVRGATADGKIAFIHPEDIAAVAALILTTEGFEGTSLPMTGPQALSYADMTAKIEAAIGKPLRFEPVTEEQVRRAMTERGEEEEVIAAHLSIYRSIREGRLAEVTDTVERVLGRKPTAFDEWVRENAAAFL